MWARTPFNVTGARDLLIRTTKLRAIRVGQAILGVVRLCWGCDLADVTSRNPYALHRVLKQRAHRHAIWHNASSHHRAHIKSYSNTSQAVGRGHKVYISSEPDFCALTGLQFSDLSDVDLSAVRLSQSELLDQVFLPVLQWRIC